MNTDPVGIGMESTGRAESLGAEMDLVFESGSDGVRRGILGHLADEGSERLSTRELVSRLVAEGTDVDDAVRERDELELVIVHEHRPKLETYGLVEAGPDGESLRVADHPAWRDTALLDLFETDLEGVRGGRVANGDHDALFEALSSGLRRTILDVLSHQFHPIHVETLARDVAARASDTPEHRVPDDVLEGVWTELRHVHLPKLADAGLVVHDRSAETVAYEGHSDLHVAWMHSVYAHEFRTSLTDDSTPRDIETIEGRGNVISYGQSMADRADEELFCMVTHKDVLEAGFFSRVLQAANRGVDVYLGTYDSTIREFVREEAPDVTLWEPATDWMRLPVESGRVGRLLLADREAVMLGTLREPTDGQAPEEKAIVGDAPDNTLVVMIRQLLQGHLERIDVDGSLGDVESSPNRHL